MAIIRQNTGPTFNVGSAVSSRIQAIQSARNKKRLQDESRFLQVVNDSGMTYDDQLKYRQKQIEDEKKSFAPDNDYITELTKDIGSLKKLSAQKRFQDAYADSFDAWTSGQKSIQSHVAFLENQLANTNDPELQANIRQDLSQARTSLRNTNDSVLENFVTYATESQESSILDEALNKVKSARTEALAGGDADRASVLLLKQQGLEKAKASSNINFKLNQLKVNGLQNPNPVRTLDFLTKSVGDSADSGPIMVNGKRYDSERDFWVQQRGDYVSNGDFFKDMKNYYGTWINNALEKNPDMAGDVMLQSKDTFSTLQTRPELQGFDVALQDALVQTVGKGAQTLAKKLIDNADTTYDYQSAADRIADISRTTGIDLSTESNLLMRNAADIRADAYGAIIGQANSLVQDGMSYPQAIAESMRLYQSGQLAVQQPSPKDLATKSPEQLAKESTTAKPVAPVVLPNQPVIEQRKPLETTTTEVRNGVEQPTKTAVSSKVSESSTTITQPPATLPPVGTPAVKLPAATPAVKKMATLINMQSGDRQAVEVDSPQSKNLFGQGYILETKPPTKVK